jgi:hypothetical protein
MNRLPCIFGLLFTTSYASAQTVPEDLLASAAPVAGTSLLSPPPGRSTVMGGTIERVDLVRDQLALKVAGGHRVRILFDERTQVFQDGKKISVLDLHPADHASVETNLDGTSIFALRIHMLSKLADGQIQARVVSYDRRTGELKVLVAASDKPLTLLAANGTQIERVGQTQFAEQKYGAADLIPGSLVSVTFSYGKTGPGTASHIDVLAVPGAEFVFRGSLSSLDLRRGRMSISNDSDRPMDIAFEPARLDVSHELHLGSMVKVTARFDGNRYVASVISVE